MRQTRKGKQWHFGMKLHVGTDLGGIVHTLVATDAAQSDIGQLARLLHGQERALYADPGVLEGVRSGLRPRARHPLTGSTVGRSRERGSPSARSSATDCARRAGRSGSTRSGW